MLQSSSKLRGTSSSKYNQEPFFFKKKKKDEYSLLIISKNLKIIYQIKNHKRNEPIYSSLKQ